MDEKVANEIKDKVLTGYIRGIHEEQNRDTAFIGFHKDFEMIVRNGDRMDRVNVDEWLKRVESMKKDSPGIWNAKTDYTFRFIDAAGYAATVKIDVFKGKVHFSTDYLLLYRIAEEWKIVSKIFSLPG